MKKNTRDQAEKNATKQQSHFEPQNALNADFERIMKFISVICEVPIVQIFLSNETNYGISTNGESIIHLVKPRLYQQTISQNETIIINDLNLDNRFDEGELSNMHFYTGIPLINKGEKLGIFCMMDYRAKELSQKQEDTFTFLAKEIIAIIEKEQFVKENNEYEKLFQISNDLICVAGTNGYFKKLNPAFEFLLGWSINDLLKSSFFDFIHPEDLKTTQKEIQKLAAGENTVNFTHRFRAKNGSYKILQWTASPESATGNLFAIARDITSETEKTRELAINENRLKTFFENSQGLMCTHDLSGKFLSVNDAGATILGYQKDELLKLSLFDIVPPSRHEYLKTYLKQLQIDKKLRGEMITLTKQGSRRVWLFNNILTEGFNGDLYVIGNAVDITEQNSLEKELKEIKRILEQTGKVARVGGWQFDVQKKEISWTKVTREIHGVEPNFEPDLEKGIAFYKEGESRDKINRAITEAIEKGKDWDLELQITTFQGEDLWVRSIGQSEFKNDKCTTLFGTFQDIDEHKKIEIEFNKSKKLLDDVLEAASGISIIATDVDGTITVFNKGAELLLGYSSEEMVGKHNPSIVHELSEIEEWGRELSDESGETISGFDVFIALAQKEGKAEQEWTYIKKDGSRLTVTLAITEIKSEENDVIGYLGIATDITVRKKIEDDLITEKARLSSFAEHAPAAVAMLDRDMKYIAVSRKWVEDYELSAKKIIGVSHYEIFPNLDKEKILKHQNVLNGAIERREEDTYKKAGTDAVQYITSEMRPWYQFDSEIGGMMIFTQNITSIILQREELRLSKQQAEEANVAKSEFLANMSHEIRTPLNGVIGFTDLVLKTNLNEIQHQYLSLVEQSANALLNIINDILDFSKIEAGKLELDIEKSDLFEIGAQASDIINHQIQTKKLEMLLNFSTDCPRFIWADSIRLKQVLVNLLGNAAKFTDKGEIELKIEVLTSEKNHTTFRFGVRDTGVGIKKNKQEKIFEAFSQEDSSTTKKYGGTGLGLTISNKLLVMMDSRLQLESTVGLGSYFYFDATFKAEEGEETVWENIDIINKVLVVDDNDNNRKIITQMLELHNIETVEAKSGFEALQFLAEAEKFDVIFMDYHMPFMDGLETVSKIRESFHPTHNEQPIILFHSSSDDIEIFKKCKEYQICQRLVKPLKTADIYYALSHLQLKREIVSKSPAVPTSSQLHGTFKIMLVEDNEVNMFLANTILRRVLPQAEVTVVRNGLECVENFEEGKFDLIFMDVQMPIMNGHEATRRWRELESSLHVPIIAITAGNVKGERERCLNEGMDDFIFKPIVEETIFLTLKKWLKVEAANEQIELQTSSISVNDEDELISEHYNSEVLKMYYDDNEEMLQEIKRVIAAQLQEFLVNVKTAIQAEDLDGLHGLGHKIRGTASTAGLTILSRMAKKLEETKEFKLADMEKTYTEFEIEVVLLNKLMA